MSEWAVVATAHGGYQEGRQDVVEVCHTEGDARRAAVRWQGIERQTGGLRTFEVGEVEPPEEEPETRRQEPPSHTR